VNGGRSGWEGQGKDEERRVGEERHIRRDELDRSTGTCILLLLLLI